MVIKISAKLNAGQWKVYIKKSIKSITPPKYILSIAFPIAPLDIITKDSFINFSLVKKEIISYKREDGLELSGVLYLPKDNIEKTSKSPMILWAYPREYKDKSSASQKTRIYRYESRQKTW